MGQYSDSFYSEGSAIMESETIYNAQIEERHATPGKTPLKLLTSLSRTRRIFAKDITAKKREKSNINRKFWSRNRWNSANWFVFKYVHRNYATSVYYLVISSINVRISLILFSMNDSDVNTTSLLFMRLNSSFFLL